jgi:hypothetical protein
LKIEPTGFTGGGCEKKQRLEDEFLVKVTERSELPLTEMGTFQG